MRIKVNSHWLPEPKFLARDALYTHAYCPECFAKEMALAEEYAAGSEIKTAAPMLTPQLAGV